MKTGIGQAVMFVALAGTAQASTDVHFLVWDGASWTNAVSVNAGTTVQCAVSVSTNETVQGFHGVVFNVLGSNLQAGGTVDVTSAGLGRQSPFDTGPATSKVFYSGNKFKIDASSDPSFPGSTNAGIALDQDDPLIIGTRFQSGTSALVYRFNVAVSAGQDLNSDIGLSTNPVEVKLGKIGWWLFTTHSGGA